MIAASAAAGSVVELDADQARHAHVRRLRIGGRVTLFDGAGRSFDGEISKIARQRVLVSIVGELPLHSGESPLEVTLALAVVKADRFEWAIEKTTELGVANVVPFTSTYSLASPSPTRRRRWQQIAVSAAKQAGRSIVPTIDGPATFAEVIARSDGLRVLCWEQSTASSWPQLAVPTQITMIVGPEGGFSEREVDAARAAGCEIIHLGPRILRAETAAVVAVALCQSRWGDLAPLGPASRVPGSAFNRS